MGGRREAQNILSKEGTYMERKWNQIRSNEGFTLVELMVVVAIIGILATLAVPQYKKFQAKSRQSEARLSLGGAYTIEQSFAAENASYTSCLGQAGYNRDGVRFYYNVGFGKSGQGQAGCGPNGQLNCYFTGWEFDPGSQTYADQGNSKCDDSQANMGIFLATAAENSQKLPNGDAGKAADMLEAQTKDGGNAKTNISQQTFIIGASGSILTAAGTVALTNEYDGWTIDQNKQLKNTQSGLF
jgi:type IV pilus assembly protein PilA